MLKLLCSFLIRTSVLHAFLIQSHLVKSLYKYLVKMTHEVLNYVISPLFSYCLSLSVSTFNYVPCSQSPPIHSLPFVKDAGSFTIYRKLPCVKIQGKSCPERSRCVSFKLGLLEKESVQGGVAFISSVDFHLRDD